MSTRHRCLTGLVLALLLVQSDVSPAQSTFAIPNEEEYARLSIEELTRQIRRDKFDQILPVVMRNHGIDMWIHVMREGNVHAFGNFVNSGFYADLGSNSGLFIFTDRGSDHIERAAIGRRWARPDGSYPLPNPPRNAVEDSGAYDIISEPIRRIETVGGPLTEYDHRFEGLREFVAERDPQRIAVNFRDKTGPIRRTPTNDGISHTDYLLLTRELGEEFAGRLVSSEMLVFEYLSRPVPSELAMYKRIREEFDAAFEEDFAKIVPGVTRPDDLSTGYEGGLSIQERFADGGRGDVRRGDEKTQRGDFFMIDHGAEGDYDLEGVRDRWKYGNFFEMKVEYGYMLREGETEPPEELRKLWAEGMKIRKVIEDTLKVGQTAAEAVELIKRNLDQVRIVVNEDQEYRDLGPEQTQVSIDLHGLGKGSYPPRIGSLGPDWQHEMTIQLYHHFAMELFIYMPLASTEDGMDHLNLWFHDGAHVTENGVEYLTPPPSEIHLIH
jgi:hypothetical protein